MCAYLVKSVSDQHNYISLILDYAFALMFGSWQNFSGVFL